MKKTYRCDCCEHECMLETNEEEPRKPQNCPWFIATAFWKDFKDD